MTYPNQPSTDRRTPSFPEVPPVYAPAQTTTVQPVTDPHRAARLAALQARQRHDETQGHTMTVVAPTASSPRRGPKRNHPAQTARTVALAGSVAATAALAMYMAGSDGVALTDTVVQSASAANESSLDTVPRADAESTLDTVPTADTEPTLVAEVPPSEIIPNATSANASTATTEATPVPTEAQATFAEAAAQAVDGGSGTNQTETPAHADQIGAFETTDSEPNAAGSFAETEAEQSSVSQSAVDSFNQSESASAPVATATAVPVPTATAVATEAPAEATTVEEATASTTGYADGTYLGSAEFTKWGDFQVQATISGGQLVSVEVIQSPGDHHSQGINSRAVPTLLNEALSLQDADIANVSGATWTSRTYKASLQAALDQAFTQGATA